MKEYAQNQIDSASADLLRLDEQVRRLEIDRAVLKSRIESFQDMLDRLPDETKPKRRKTSRGRSLSDAWRHVLHLMATEGAEGADYDDIHSFTKRAGIAMKQENLRGHMGNYKATGYVNSVSPGVFIVTGQGKDLAKPMKHEEPEASTSGSPEELGPVTGRGTGFPSDTPSGSIPDGSTHISKDYEGGFDEAPSRPDEDEIPF